MEVSTILYLFLVKIEMKYPVCTLLRLIVCLRYSMVVKFGICHVQSIDIWVWYGIIHLEKKFYIVLEGEHEAAVVLLWGLTYGIFSWSANYYVLQKVVK